jgi:hypothetical protein
MKYFVRQHFPSLDWQVVTISDDQARSMVKRGVTHIFKKSNQAYAVRDRLQGERDVRQAKGYSENPAV